MQPKPNKVSSSVWWPCASTGICRPDGAGLPRRSRTKAGELGGAGGYKDFVPDGAFGQPQRGCSIQPSVGAQRLRWVNGQKENNSEGVEAGGTAKYAKYANGNSGFIFRVFRVVRGGIGCGGGFDATPSALKTFWGT